MLGRERPQLKKESADESFPPQVARAGAALRLTITFMLVVVMVFLAVEGWRTWRDYRSWRERRPSTPKTPSGKWTW